MSTETQDAQTSGDTESLELLQRAIWKQPLHKHIYRKILVYLNEAHTTEETEAFIAEVPEFAYAIYPEGRLLDVLERAGGIERQTGAERLGEDPADDLGILDGITWVTTELGQQYVEASDPLVQLRELVALKPEREATYRFVLKTCNKAPQTRDDLLEAIDAYRTKHGDEEEIKSSVYLDRLERVGGLYWKDKWTITDEGAAFYAELSE